MSQSDTKKKVLTGVALITAVSIMTYFIIKSANEQQSDDEKKDEEKKDEEKEQEEKEQSKWQLLVGEAKYIACGNPNLIAACTSEQAVCVMTDPAHKNWILTDGRGVMPACSYGGDFALINSDGKVSYRVPMPDGRTIWSLERFLDAIIVKFLCMIDRSHMILLTHHGQIWIRLSTKCHLCYHAQEPLFRLVLRCRLLDRLLHVTIREISWSANMTRPRLFSNNPYE